MMKYKLCIFDLDGTTVDSLQSIAHTANERLTANGLPAHPVEAYKKFAGDGQNKLIERALLAAGDTELQLYDKVMAEYIEAFAAGCTYGARAFDGIKEMLQQLHAAGIKTAILSNKKHENAVTVIDSVFGKDEQGVPFFDEVMGQMDSYPKKPNPFGAFMLSGEFEAEPEECVYVGDTDTDMKTGKAAGMMTVGVTWGFRDREELLNNGADVIADSPNEIVRLALGVNND